MKIDINKLSPNARFDNNNCILLFLNRKTAIKHIKNIKNGIIEIMLRIGLISNEFLNVSIIFPNPFWYHSKPKNQYRK